VKAVIDTNVPVVANDLDREFPDCVAACAERLARFQRRGTLVLDDGWRILREYMRHLRSTGQPGVGDAFLKWVLTNISNPSRCRFVSITDAGEPTGFAEFPNDTRLAAFDRSDRKFVAVALAGPDRPPILQALDSAWWPFTGVLAEHGVRVDFICPDAIQLLHERRRP